MYSCHSLPARMQAQDVEIGQSHGNHFCPALTPAPCLPVPSPGIKDMPDERRTKGTRGNRPFGIEHNTIKRQSTQP